GDPVRETQRPRAAPLDQKGERVDIARLGADDELRVTGWVHAVSLHTPLTPSTFRLGRMPRSRWCAGRSQGMSTTRPTAWRLSRYACAAAASAKGKVRSIST